MHLRINSFSGCILWRMANRNKWTDLQIGISKNSIFENGSEVFLIFSLKCESFFSSWNSGLELPVKCTFLKFLSIIVISRVSVLFLLEDRTCILYCTLFFTLFFIVPYFSLYSLLSRIFHLSSIGSSQSSSYFHFSCNMSVLWT